MPSRYSSYDTYSTYYYNNDAANSRQIRKPIVVDVPADTIESIRKRELAIFYGEPETSLVLYKDNSQQNGGQSGNVSPSRQLVKSRTTDDYVRRSQSTRRSQASNRYNGNSVSRSQSVREGRSQSGRDARSRTAESQGNQDQSQQQQQQGQQQNQQQQKHQCLLNKEKIEEGQLAAKIRDKESGNFIQRNFDSSWDGVIAAGAGAAIGAITARRIQPLYATEEENKMASKKRRAQLWGGAVVGATAFNFAENRFRLWYEEKEEHAEAAQIAGELCCEGLDNFPIIK